MLESQLGRINGNLAYLNLLRDAYRAHVRQLRLANQEPDVQRYLRRLQILDPGATLDLAAIKGASRPVALVGTQLRWSVRREAYPEFVRTFGMPVYVNGLGRGSLPPEDPHFFSRTRKPALKQADVVLIFGTPLDFRIGYGRDSHINPEATLIQVDIDPCNLFDPVVADFHVTTLNCERNRRSLL